MNKRIKKKRELESKLQTLDMTVDFLLDQNNQLWKIVDKMEKINSGRLLTRWRKSTHTTQRLLTNALTKLRRISAPSKVLKSLGLVVSKEVIQHLDW